MFHCMHIPMLFMHASVGEQRVVSTLAIMSNTVRNLGVDKYLCGHDVFFSLGYIPRSGW